MKRDGDWYWFILWTNNWISNMWWVDPIQLSAFNYYVLRKENFYELYFISSMTQIRLMKVLQLSTYCNFQHRFVRWKVCPEFVYIQRNTPYYEFDYGIMTWGELSIILIIVIAWWKSWSNPVMGKRWFKVSKHLSVNIWEKQIQNENHGKWMASSMEKKVSLH